MKQRVCYWIEFDEICLTGKLYNGKPDCMLVLLYDKDNDIKDAVEIHKDFYYSKFIDLGYIE